MLDNVEMYINSLGNRKQVIVGGDFNAHAKLWGADKTTDKGRRLARGMEIVNLN